MRWEILESRVVPRIPGPRSIEANASPRPYATGFLYDGLNLAQELSAGSPSANFLSGLSLDDVFTRTGASGSAHLLTDALGSTVALSDASGAVSTSYTFQPFGATTHTGAATANSVEFTGRENDGTPRTRGSDEEVDRPHQSMRRREPTGGEMGGVPDLLCGKPRGGRGHRRRRVGRQRTGDPPPVAALAHQGRLSGIISRALLNRLQSDGVRVRQYTLDPGETVPCAAFPGDVPVGAIDDIPVAAAATGVLWATPGAFVRSMPSQRLRLTFRASDGAGDILSEYVLDHRHKA
jgi:hypothetical protein